MTASVYAYANRKSVRESVIDFGDLVCSRVLFTSLLTKQTSWPAGELEATAFGHDSQNPKL